MTKLVSEGAAPTVQIGVVGYGAGGRLSHTPYVRGAHGVELAGVVSGVERLLSASKTHRLVRRELALLGSDGSFVVRGPDVQAEAIGRGERPEGRRALWGYAAPEDWGMLIGAEGPARVPSAQGDYCRYYEEFARAVRTWGAPPVTAAEVAAVLDVLDAARRSDGSQQVVRVPVRWGQAFDEPVERDPVSLGGGR